MKRNTLALAAASLSLLSACTKLAEKTPVETFSTTVDSTTTTTTTASQSMALDATFGNEGKVITALSARKDVARAVAMQSDGRLVVAGQSQVVDSSTKIRYAFSMVRYDAIGSLDRTFGVDPTNASSGPGSGIVVTSSAGNAEAFSMKIDASNNIYLAGSVANGSNTDFAVTKYLPHGIVDRTFNFNGTRLTDFYGRNDVASAIALDSSGKIVLAGTAHDLSGNSQFALARINAGGTGLDTTFGTVSTVVAPLHTMLNGKVTARFGLARNQGASAVVLQTDGKIVVAGWVQVNGQRTTDFALARFLTTGALDTAFGNQGVVNTDFGTSKDDSAAAVAIQSDGKILVAGYTNNGRNTDFALARYNTDGKPDTTFGANGRVKTDFGFDDYITSIVVQSSGGILATGYSLVDNFYRFAVARYLSDGSVDTGFGSSGRQAVSFGASTNAFGRASLVASDGSLFLAGEAYPGASELDFAVAKWR